MAYTAVYERDEDGAWIVRVKGVRGCHTYGRTLEQARSRVREALSLYVEDAETAEIRDKVELGELNREIVATLRAREKAEHATAEAEERLRDAVEALQAKGLSLRDSGALLGLTRQRIQQILSAATGHKAA